MTKVNEETITQKIMAALGVINPSFIEKTKDEPGGITIYSVNNDLFVIREQNKIETSHGDGCIYLVRINAEKSNLDLGVDSRIFHKIEKIFNLHEKEQKLINFDNTLDILLKKISLQDEV